MANTEAGAGGRFVARIGQSVHRRFRALKSMAFFGLLTAISFQASVAVADVAAEFAEDIRIEAATVSPADVGGRATVRFRIVNGGDVGLHLLGVSTQLARNADLIADIGDGKTAKFDSIGIPAGQSLDLTTSHLRYEIYPLATELRMGAQISVVLRFVQGDVPISVHVHRTGADLPMAPAT